MEYINIVPNGPSAIPVNNKQFIQYLTKTINYAYNIRNNNNTFPAPQPVSIERKNFDKFKTYEYNVTLKLDGTRFLIYFMLDKHQNKQIILINRALNFFKVNINCENNLFDGSGTLLDGELIFYNNKWSFYVHDGLILCGNRINKDYHRNRIDNIKYCLDSYLYNDDYNTFQITTKTFYAYDNINDFIDNVYNSSLYPSNDGLIFMPNKLPVVSGTQYSMFKWKPYSKNTFDFQLIENNENLIAKVYHLNNLIDFANILYSNECGKIFIDKAKQLENYENNCIIECNFNEEKQNFVPVLIRTDKTHPNSLRTIERTLFNISENIKIDDFRT